MRPRAGAVDPHPPFARRRLVRAVRCSAIALSFGCDGRPPLGTRRPFRKEKNARAAARPNLGAATAGGRLPSSIMRRNVGVTRLTMRGSATAPRATILRTTSGSIGDEWSQFGGWSVVALSCPIARFSLVFDRGTPSAVLSGKTCEQSANRPSNFARKTKMSGAVLQSPAIQFPFGCGDSLLPEMRPDLDYVRYIKALIDGIRSFTPAP